MKNQFDKNGRAHGLWKDYLSNGDLIYRGVFNHGKLHGPWMRYYSSGELRYKGAYKRGKRVGLWYELNK